MSPLQLLCVVLSLADQYEAKHGKKPSRVLVPACYGSLLGYTFSPVDTVDTFTRLSRLSWLEIVDVSMRHESIEVE